MRTREDAHTVLQRMAIEADRARRIHDLKQSRPDLTWSDIAEKVGVRERSAIQWQQTGGIDYSNAKRLAKVFGVTVEWLWSGVGQQPASAPATVDLQAELAEINRKLDALIKRLEDQRLTERLAGFEAGLAEIAERLPPQQEPNHGTG